MSAHTAGVNEEYLRPDIVVDAAWTSGNSSDTGEKIERRPASVVDL